MKSIEVAKDIIFWLKYYAKNPPNPDYIEIYDIDYEISNTKVQKLLYLVFGFSLINDIRPLEIVEKDDGMSYASVIDEYPVAWPYGPVFQNVYRQFDKIKNSVKNKPCESLDKDFLLQNLLNKDELLQQIIQNTVKQWGCLKAYALTNWSHEAHSPWDQVVNVEQKPLGTIIDAHLVRDYFKSNVENIIS
jgi:uncharacterized phage-associated protein